MLILLGVLSASASLVVADAKALAKQSFDERLDAIHAVRRCYYEKAVASPGKAGPERAKWLRGQCAGAETGDVAVWVRWLPEMKAQIPDAAERNHQAIAEEVAADPSPELSLPTPTP